VLDVGTWLIVVLRLLRVYHLFRPPETVEPLRTPYLLFGTSLPDPIGRRASRGRQKVSIMRILSTSLMSLFVCLMLWLSPGSSAAELPDAVKASGLDAARWEKVQQGGFPTDLEPFKTFEGKVAAPAKTWALIE